MIGCYHVMHLLFWVFYLEVRENMIQAAGCSISSESLRIIVDLLISQSIQITLYVYGILMSIWKINIKVSEDNGLWAWFCSYELIQLPVQLLIYAFFLLRLSVDADYLENVHSCFVCQVVNINVFCWSFGVFC